MAFPSYVILPCSLWMAAMGEFLIGADGEVEHHHLNTTSCLSQNKPSDGRSTDLSSGACCLRIGDSIQMCVGCAVCHQLILAGSTPSSLASAYACILQGNHRVDPLTSIAEKDPAGSLMHAALPDVTNRHCHR